MKYTVLTILVPTALSFAGCAVTVPCAAKASNGMTFIGSATAPISPKPGRFELYSATGLKCYGTYNQWDYNLTIQVPFYVSAGRHGIATVSRDNTGRNAIGVGQANDGTTFTFLVGAAMQQIQFRGRGRPQSA
jgi:hypothetical protein